MIFGKQKVEGCWASLKKPLVIMARPCVTRSGGSDRRFCSLRRALTGAARPRHLQNPWRAQAKVEGGEGVACEYHARGVVRQKLVFKSRPVPITRPVAMSKRVRLDGPGDAEAPLAAVDS